MSRSSMLGNTYVNASLIHEVRMLVVHGLRAFNEGRRGPMLRPKVQPVVTNTTVQGWVPLCVVCVNSKTRGFTNNEPRPAITMQEGNSLCKEHV